MSFDLKTVYPMIFVLETSNLICFVLKTFYLMTMVLNLFYLMMTILDYDCCNDILSNDFVLKTIEPNDFSSEDI